MFRIVFHFFLAENKICYVTDCKDIKIINIGMKKEVNNCMENCKFIEFRIIKN